MPLFSSPTPLPFSEFQSTNDAWYSAAFELESGADGDDDNSLILRVMFLEFSSSFDERCSADSFRSLEEVESFGRRFRPTSIQMQDSQCRTLKIGAGVVASHAFGPCDVRFYDAVVVSVNSKEHPQDQCSCTFLVRWQHGPLIGKETQTCVENVCLHRPKHIWMDPIVKKFLDTSRQILQKKLSQMPETNVLLLENSRRNLEDAAACYLGNDENTSSSSRSSESPVGPQPKKFRYSLTNIKDRQSSKVNDAKRNKLKEGRGTKDIPDDDIDLGSDLSNKKADFKKSLYFVQVENLEKDLSPFDVTEFFLKKASVASHAFICPSRLGKLYLRATILVKTEDEASKLYEFLYDPSYIITSLSGRPWVTDAICSGSIDGTMPRYQMPSKKDGKGGRSKIQLVYKGSRVYELAKREQAKLEQTIKASYGHNYKDLETLIENDLQGIRNQL